VQEVDVGSGRVELLAELGSHALLGRFQHVQRTAGNACCSPQPIEQVPPLEQIDRTFLPDVAAELVEVGAAVLLVASAHVVWGQLVVIAVPVGDSGAAR
jgi:hypothetical protein